MVFSSVHLYPDPPNWNQQGGSTSTDITIDEPDHVNPLPQPLPTSSTSAPHQVSTGGSTCRPVPVVSTAERARLAKIPQAEAALKCPRCDSTNTKFCYFNNYSLTQPRHFCKTCRRYWTRGGALRSVPVGGGCRRNKRGNKPSSSKSASSTSLVAPSASSSTSLAGVFRTAPPPFLASWNHFPDYGIQQPIDTSMESMGLEQWRIQQIQHFPFLGELSVPTGSMVPGVYPLEGELVGGHGKMIMSTVKMEESSQAANMPRQFFNMGRNDGQIWPVSGGGEDQGGRWISGEHVSGFSSSSTGNLL